MRGKPGAKRKLYRNRRPVHDHRIKRASVKIIASQTTATRAAMFRVSQFNELLARLFAPKNT